MAATEKAVLVTLDSLKWKNIALIGGGGGVSPRPSLSPYLWTLYFKLDGTSVWLGEDYFLFGFANVEPARGIHGDLGVWSMSVGESAKIPEALGLWSSNLVPFFIAPSAQPFFDTPGIPNPQAVFGSIVILLRDGGHIPPQAVDAGRIAFTNGVQAFLDSKIPELGVSQPGITQSDLDKAQENISKAVTEAMKNSLSNLQKLWAWSGQDEFIASWIITGDAGQQSWSEVRAGGSEVALGTWELAYNVTISDPCPADAIAAIIDGIFGRDRPEPEPAPLGASWSSDPLGAMRDFRDCGGLRERPGLRQWWAAARANTPEIARILVGDERLGRAAATVLMALPAALKDPGERADKGMVQALNVLLEAFEKEGSTRLKVAAVNARHELDDLTGLPVGEVLDRLGADPAPSRKGPRNPIGV